MQVTGFNNATFVPFTSQATGIPQDSPGESGFAGTAGLKRDILFDSFRSSQRKVPALEASGPLALFRTSEVLRFLSQRSNSGKLPLGNNLEKRDGFTDLRRSRLDDLSDSLLKLKQTVSTLRGKDALNVRRARSSLPRAVQAEAGKNSPLTTLSVRPTQLAAGNVLVSDPQTAPLGALGLIGSFFVNGVKVTVKASDSVFDIRGKINFGEDINRNGVLDGPEDLNGNNILDTYSVSGSESGPGVYVNEDLNGNGTLDPSEDVNKNHRLDGGITEIRARADIKDNRLVLTSLAGGNTKIDLRDEDNILLALGFFEKNSKGLPILKEQQFDSGNPPVNLIINPRPARIELDGKTVQSPTNGFPGAVEDTGLTVKQVSARKAEVRIFVDASNAVSQIQVLFDRFNDAVGILNDVLAGSLAFERDESIQNIRQDLVLPAQENTQKLNERNRNLDKVRGNFENRQGIGIEVKNLEKNRVQEISLTSAVKNLKSGMTIPFKNTGRDLLERLTSIGIRTGEDNFFKVDATQLDRALHINPGEVLDLFENPETGILPNLESQLSRILDENLGDLALKQQESAIFSQTPDQLAEKFRRFQESSTFGEKVQKLIVVI